MVCSAVFFFCFFFTEYWKTVTKREIQLSDFISLLAIWFWKCGFILHLPDVFPSSLPYPSLFFIYSLLLLVMVDFVVTIWFWLYWKLVLFCLQNNNKNYCTVSCGEWNEESKQWFRNSFLALILPLWYLLSFLTYLFIYKTREWRKYKERDRNEPGLGFYYVNKSVRGEKNPLDEEKLMFT